MHVVQGLRAAEHLEPCCFGYEAGTTAARIPVVVTEMVEAGVRHGPALPRFLDGDAQVERGTGGSAAALRDDAGTSSERIRYAHSAFVRVGRQALNHSISRPSHQRMHRLRRSHHLQVAIGTRMKIRPTDRGRLAVVTTAPRGLGIGVDRLEILCGTQCAELRKTSTEILMVAGEQDSTSGLSE